MSRHILVSFDLEEFDIPQEYGAAVDAETQMRVGREAMPAILDLLRRTGCRATFFTTANFAQHHPELMRQVAAEHEVASHGFFHSSFEDADLRKSREALEAVTGTPCLGFRRARLAETDRGEIARAGYRYNSSENPIYLPGRYNHFFDKRTAYWTDGLLNVPISASPLVRFPLFWLAFKNFPMPAIRAASAWTLRHDGYLNVFFHPWEFTSLAAWDTLPSVVRKIDGQTMLDRLEAYLRWLAPRGRFSTFTDFDAARRAARER